MKKNFGDDYNDGFEDDAPESNEFAKLFEASQKPKGQGKLSPGDKVQAEVIVIGKDEIYVSLGANRDGSIFRPDLADEAGNISCKVGDVLDLFVTQVRGNEIRLSPKLTSKALAEDIRSAYELKMPIPGKVVESCNGGFRVQIKGKLAFCPISQMDIKHVDAVEPYIGQRYDFEITKFEEGGRNIVVSRRRLLEKQLAAATGSFTEQRKVGDIVRGRVSRLEKFGAFIEISPGLDGLAHVSELAWSRVGDPSEVVAIGQDVSAKIIKIETLAPGKLRIGLSLKQVGGEPWENLPPSIAVGQVLEGRVTNCAKFGAFVELVPGIEGLVPLSEMSYTKRVMRSDELMKQGETVAVMIKEVDLEKRRIGLSFKDAAGADPWSLVSQKFPVGTIVEAKVEKREAYGLFLKLEEGVTGLLPKSKANEAPEFPFEKLKVGDLVVVQVGELRVAERRISLQPPGDSSRDDWKKYEAQQNTMSSASGGSLGTLADKFKAALEKKRK